MKINPVKWFYEVWPFEQQRAAALSGYRALAQEPRTLADIALRGYVLTTTEVRGDRDATLINEGRRQMALEILELAGGIDIDRLWATIPKNPGKTERNP